ncbi:hypothetical protein DCAR_0935823 [Daucus carota subsp. sativus]|uniref:Mediator-associated protein 2 n=2 Tax=Daucus carota subsp. sativus TaxID=79200 RepID=A0AAF0XXS5_DAUCS|nr:hypothetical protein DCAR_0935823 [Daucus carota subsp. sativus]
MFFCSYIYSFFVVDLVHLLNKFPASDMGYEPAPDFQQSAKDPLVDLNLTDSSELWLIQWPLNQAPDFDGKEVTLKLHHDGHLGSFEGSSGKAYDVVSFASQNSEATVFSSSASKTKIVGKIARRVSFVHYPEPEELEEQNPKDLKQMYEKSSSLTKSSVRFATPSQSSRSKHLQSGSSGLASSHSSGRRSHLSASGGSSKASKRKTVDEPSKSEQHSEERKSKKKK